jgi:hypothetical protein
MTTLHRHLYWATPEDGHGLHREARRLQYSPPFVEAALFKPANTIPVK